MACTSLHALCVVQKHLYWTTASMNIEIIWKSRNNLQPFLLPGKLPFDKHCNFCNSCPLSEVRSVLSFHGLRQCWYGQTVQSSMTGWKYCRSLRCSPEVHWGFLFPSFSSQSSSFVSNTKSKESKWNIFFLKRTASVFPRGEQFGVSHCFGCSRFKQDPCFGCSVGSGLGLSTLLLKHGSFFFTLFNCDGLD